MGLPIIGVCKEHAPGERRVALTPDCAGRVARNLRVEALVEARAGTAAGFDDLSYVREGARIVTQHELLHEADLCVAVRPPNVPPGHRYRSGQILLCTLRPREVPYLVRHWAEDGVTAIGANLAPPGCLTAESMNPAAAQNRLAGYAAVTVAAHALIRSFSGAVAGTRLDPAQVLVVGSGQAAVHAAATAQRLGGLVCAVGLDTAPSGELITPGTERQEPARRPRGVAGPIPDSLNAGIADSDVVIVTEAPADASSRPWVTTSAVQSMRPGSVVVDMTASAFGSTVESARPHTTVVVEPGVTVIGETELASRCAKEASAAYASSISQLLAEFVHNGELRVDPAHPVHVATLVTHDRNVLHEDAWHSILEVTALAGLP